MRTAKPENIFIGIVALIIVIGSILGAFFVLGAAFALPLALAEGFVAIFWIVTSYIPKVGKWMQVALIVLVIGRLFALGFQGEFGDTSISKRVIRAQYITVQGATYFISDNGEFGQSDSNGIIQVIGRVNGTTMIYQNVQYKLTAFVPELPILATSGSVKFPLTLQ